MAICSNVSPKHRKLCAGDLDKEIQIIDPNLLPPINNTVDYDIEIDTDTAPIVYASVSTPRGKTIFDGTNTERDVTHVFGVYYDESYTIEDAIVFDGRIFDVLDVNDLEERHEWMLLSCTERGTTANVANY